MNRLLTCKFRHITFPIHKLHHQNFARQQVRLVGDLYLKVHLSRKLKCTIVIMRFPSSVRPSSLTFHIFGKSIWPPWPLIGWEIFDFLEIIERNITKFDRMQDLNVLFQVCFFRVNWKRRLPPWPMIGWYILDFSSETAKGNSTKLDRNQDLDDLYHFLCFSCRSVNKNGRPAQSVKKSGTLYSGARYVGPLVKKILWLLAAGPQHTTNLIAEKRNVLLKHDTM